MSNREVDGMSMMYLVADENDCVNAKLPKPNLCGCAAKCGPLPFAQEPEDFSDEDVSQFNNPWDMIQNGCKSNLKPGVKCQDIFIGDSDCSQMITACNCAKELQTKPKFKGVKAGMTKGKPNPNTCLQKILDGDFFDSIEECKLRPPRVKGGLGKSKKSSKLRKSKNKTQTQPSDSCTDCEKSRRYLEYLTKTLEDFKKSSNCKESSEKQPKKRKRNRIRIPAALPRCACPPPCGDEEDKHLACKTGTKAVPPYMGWDWKSTTLNRKGWKPGAIPKNIRELMCHFMKPCPLDTIPVTKLPPNPVIPAQPPYPSIPAVDPPFPIAQRPMIRVNRRNDEFTITMLPLKKTSDLKSDPDPYLDCEPIQIKISGNKEARRLAHVRQMIWEKGFQRCTCGRSVAECECRDNREMEALRQCVAALEKKFNLDELEKKLNLHEKEDLTLDFTPPAAIVKPQLKDLPEDVSVVEETQYNEQDIDEDNSTEKKGKPDKKEKPDKKDKSEKKEKPDKKEKGKDKERDKGSKGGSKENAAGKGAKPKKLVK